jgi:DNA-binding NtrC family response regulator
MHTPSSVFEGRLDHLADLAAGLTRLAHSITSLRRLARDVTTLRVLLVAQDPALRQAMRGALQGAAHQASEAVDFADALVRLATDAFDAIVTGEQLGSTGSGRLLLAEVRGRWPFIRRVLCTADAARHLQPGLAHQLLRLPLDQRSLLASLEGG